MTSSLTAAVDDAITTEIAERLRVSRRVSNALVRESLVLMDELDAAVSTAEHARIVVLIDAMSSRCDQVSRALEEIGEELRVFKAA